MTNDHERAPSLQEFLGPSRRVVVRTQSARFRLGLVRTHRAGQDASSFRSSKLPTVKNLIDRDVAFDEARRDRLDFLATIPGQRSAIINMIRLCFTVSYEIENHKKTRNQKAEERNLD